MLVIGRKCQQTINLYCHGEKIELSVVRDGIGRTRLGIHANKDAVTIVRGENDQPASTRASNGDPPEREGYGTQTEIQRPKPRS